MRPGFRLPLFGLILLGYLAAGGLFAMLTPPWQSPDEPAHYNYVHYLAVQPGFPELVERCYNQAYLEELTTRRFPSELSLADVCYEFYQPPLYYLAVLPVFAASGGSLTALRLFSVALGAGVVALAYFIGQTLFPERPEIAYGTMALTAFVPMHVAILASVNNDVLAELIVALALLLLVRRLAEPGRPSTRSDVLLGLILGLGLITKLTVYVLAGPLIGLTLWLGRAERGWRVLLRQAAIIYGLGLLMALPWYVRNAVLYGGGDILGLGRHDTVVIGQLRTADFLAEVGWGGYAGRLVTTTFHSFWGQFGWMAVPMDERTYLCLTLLTLLALGGLVAFFKRQASPQAEALRPGQRRGLLVMGAAVGLMALAYGGYNLSLVQFQGRYLFPALIPLGLFFALGLAEALAPERTWQVAAGLAAVLGWVLVAALLADDLDRRVALAVGLGLLLAVGRAGWPRARAIPAGWLMAAGYTGLALLTLASPFWFVVPYL